MAGKIVEITLFGACSVASIEQGIFAVTGAKHKALFALLVTAPFGRRTRTFLQETLWGQACYDTGRQSLRRALADIKALMGDAYGALLSSTNSDLTIDLSKVSFAGRPGVHPFLEGLDVKEPGFSRWRNAIRENPGQLAGLYGLSHQSPSHAVLPTVAVLPFRSIPGEADDAVLGDWLAEETCRSLSRSHLLSVISHLSAREFARGIVEISAVRSVLKADFCVNGSLRRSAGMVILDADLVDTRSGRIVWTRQFVRTQASFVAYAGEGITEIIKAIGSSIADEALTHVRGQLPAQIEDHRLLIAGVSLMHRATLRDFARARELLEEALRRAPQTPEIHAWLGKWYVLSVFNRWSTDAARETQLARDATARALDMSPDNSFCLTIDGFVEGNLVRRLDTAEQRYNAALAANPNESLAWLLKGAVHTFQSDGPAAIAAAERGQALSPIDPFGYFYDALAAGAHLSNGAYERALELAERSITINDRHISTLRIKLFALHFLDQRDESRAVGQELLLKAPEMTIADYLKNHPSADFRMGRMMAEALAAAGVPSGHISDRGAR
jgi:TolB-like protein